MLWLSLKVGLFESLSQETTFSLEGNVFSRTVLFDLFENTVLCEETNNLPCLMEFTNLHLTEALKEVKKSIKGTSGIYCIANQDKGTMYIKFSVDIHGRIMEYLIYNVSLMCFCRMLLPPAKPEAAFSLKVIEL